MRRFQFSSPPLQRRAALAVGSLAIVAVSGYAGPATAERATDECPEAFPVGDLVRNQPVTGLTVAQDTEPEGFTGSVIGVLDNGIASGVDMILMRLSNSEIDRVGSIWAGMSGSPVYAADGRLIGAVSYGLSWGPSTVAGVTPAADMQSYLSTPGAGTPPRDTRGRYTPAKRVDLPRGTADRLVASGLLTAQEADGGLKQLAMPLAVSGVRGEDRVKLMKRLMGLKGTKVFAAGATPAAPDPAPAGPSDIFAGGNLGVSLAYGDFSAVGIGTVTAVCGDEVLGFGHPMNYDGVTTAGLHGADALYVQEDPVGVPFKVANPAAPVGVIQSDRIAAVKGLLGTLPPSTTITSTATLEGEDERTATTYAPVKTYVPDVTALAAAVNNDAVFDAWNSGSAALTYTVNGRTEAGRPFAVSVGNRMVSSWDIAYDAPQSVYFTVSQLQGNEFTAVTIDSVTQTTDLSTDASVYRIGKVEQKQAGQWRTLTQKRGPVASPGQKLKLRVTTDSFRDKLPVRTVRVNTFVPDSFRGDGYLRVAGSRWFDYFFEGNGGTGGADNFEEFIDILGSRPRNDQIKAQFISFKPRSGRADRGQETTSAPQDHVVRGSRTFSAAGGGSEGCFRSGPGVAGRGC